MQVCRGWLQRDVSVLLRTVADSAHLAERLFAAQTAETARLPGILAQPSAQGQASRHRPPVQRLGVPAPPRLVPHSKPLAQQTAAVRPAQRAQTARPVAGKVVAPAVPAVDVDGQPARAALLQEDWRVRVEAEAGQVVLGECLGEAQLSH